MNTAILMLAVDFMLLSNREYTFKKYSISIKFVY